MDMNYTKLMKKKKWKIIKAPILKDQMKQLRPKKEPQEVSPQTFQVPWVGLPSTIGGLGWGPKLYGINPTMYLTMVKLQLPLF